jgi:hypothetical protein
MGGRMFEVGLELVGLCKVPLYTANLQLNVVA